MPLAVRDSLGKRGYVSLSLPVLRGCMSDGLGSRVEGVIPCLRLQTRDSLAKKSCFSLLLCVLCLLLVFSLLSSSFHIVGRASCRAGVGGVPTDRAKALWLEGAARHVHVSGQE